MDPLVCALVTAHDCAAFIDEAVESALAEPRTLYRYHGANMSLGSSGARRERELRTSLGLQRWFLNRLRPGDVPADEVRAAWRSHERFKLELRLEAAGAYAAPSVSASTSRCAGRAAS